MRTKLLKIAIGMSKVAIYAMIICQSFTMAMGTETEAQQKLLKEIGVDLNVNESKGTLLNLIAELEEKSGFHFAYSKESLKDLRVEVPAGNWKMDHLLKEISVQGRLSIRRVNSTITLMPVDENESLPMIEEGFSQQTISGKITDENGEALPGASVVVKGTTNGTTTDIDGLFNLNCPEDAVITVSFVGYETQEIAINNRSVIDLQLSLDLDQLDEVVVVGYGTQKKVNLTGAVSAVEMDKVLGDRPVTDAAKALQGTIPGLQITYGSGQPGSEVDINIRGVESINGGQPLVLVDNVPMDINDVNPRDIKSVSVLKDAASASIYGARAAFGVVLITTKRGSKNRPPEFNYSTTIGWNHPTTVPEKASPREFVQALQDWGQSDFWTGQDVDTWLDYIDEYNANPSAYPEGIIYGPNDLPYIVRGSDAVGDFLDNAGFQQLHNFTVSGGSETSTYRVSLGMTDEDGIMVSDKDTYRRYNFNASLSSDLTSNLTATVTAMYKNGLKRDPVAGDWRRLYLNATNHPTAIPSGYGTLEDGSSAPYDTPENRVLLSPVRKNYDEVLRLSGQLTYNITDNINLNAQYTYQKDNYKRDVPYFEPGMIDPLRLTYGEYNPVNSNYYVSSAVENYHALNLYGNIQQEFGGHSFNLLAGMNQEFNDSTAFSASRQHLLSQDVLGLSPGIGTIDVGDAFKDFGVIGFFGRINYSFEDKYLLELNGRYDGSSRFPEGNRFGFFPSASAAWRVSNESFMDPVTNVISNLKFRGSFGEIGNQDIRDNYAYLPTMDAFQLGWISSSTGLNAVSLRTPGIVSSSFTWERVRTLDIGLDLGFFDDKLSTTVDWYHRKTLDMLAPGAELPAVLGGNAPLNNVADLSNKGWELSIAWRDHINDFQYNLGFNLFDSQTEILKYDNEGGLLNQYYVGQTIGEIWGYTTAGYFTVDDFESGTLNDDLTGGTLRNGIAPLQNVDQNPGDIRYVDLNGDGVVWGGNNTLEDPGDQTIIGNSTRRFQFGITGGARYKNFDLSFLIQGVAKRDIWNSSIEVFPFSHRWTTIYKHQLDYWTQENTDAFYPRNYAYGQGNYANSRRVQTKYLLNGAYMRVKNITLGYTFPEKVLNWAKISNFRIFLTAENLFNFDHLPPGLDPEFKHIANDSQGNYPYLKNYSGGINLTF